MAETATEYKERLLRQLNGDGARAERTAAWLESELQYAETPAISDSMNVQIAETIALSDFLKAAALVLEDVDAT